MLVSRSNGPPVVLTTWKGRPTAICFREDFPRARRSDGDLHADSRGEIPCPDLREGPWSLLVQVVDKMTGQRDGRSYAEIRYKAALAIGAEAAFGPAVAACLARVKESHGATGPWAVAGYRIRERALKELGLSRQSHELEVDSPQPG